MLKKSLVLVMIALMAASLIFMGCDSGSAGDDTSTTPTTPGVVQDNLPRLITQTDLEFVIGRGQTGAYNYVGTELSNITIPAGYTINIRDRVTLEGTVTVNGVVNINQTAAVYAGTGKVLIIGGTVTVKSGGALYDDTLQSSSYNIKFTNATANLPAIELIPSKVEDAIFNQNGTITVTGAVAGSKLVFEPGSKLGATEAAFGSGLLVRGASSGDKVDNLKKLVASTVFALDVSGDVTGIDNLTIGDWSSYFSNPSVKFAPTGSLTVGKSALLMSGTLFEIGNGDPGDLLTAATAKGNTSTVNTGLTSIKIGEWGRAYLVGAKDQLTQVTSIDIGADAELCAPFATFTALSSATGAGTLYATLTKGFAPAMINKFLGVTNVIIDHIGSGTDDITVPTGKSLTLIQEEVAAGTVSSLKSNLIVDGTLNIRGGNESGADAKVISIAAGKKLDASKGTVNIGGRVNTLVGDAGVGNNIRQTPTINIVKANLEPPKGGTIVITPDGSTSVPSAAAAPTTAITSSIIINASGTKGTTNAIVFASDGYIWSTSQWANNKIGWRINGGTSGGEFRISNVTGSTFALSLGSGEFVTDIGANTILGNDPFGVGGANGGIITMTGSVFIDVLGAEIYGYGTSVDAYVGLTLKNVVVDLSSGGRINVTEDGVLKLAGAGSNLYQNGSITTNNAGKVLGPTGEGLLTLQSKALAGGIQMAGDLKSAGTPANSTASYIYGGHQDTENRIITRNTRFDFNETAVAPFYKGAANIRIVN